MGVADLAGEDLLELGLALDGLAGHYLGSIDRGRHLDGPQYPNHPKGGASCSNQ